MDFLINASQMSFAAKWSSYQVYAEIIRIIKCACRASSYDCERKREARKKRPACLYTQNCCHRHTHMWVSCYHSLTPAYTAKTTLKHVFKLHEDIPVTPSRHRPVLSSEEGSSRVYFYTRSLTPTYISSQLLVRTEDTSTWVVIISSPDMDSWDGGRGKMRRGEMRRED